ncbi:MAG: ATP-dependent DNA ligase [Candidatus Bathyarchaeia archaeon]
MGTATHFLRLVNILKELESTSSRKEKTLKLSLFLKEISQDEISPSVMLISGSIFPYGSGQALNVSSKTLSKVLSTCKQGTLDSSPLTIKGLYSQLVDLASLNGRGSKARRKVALSSLLSRANNVETEYISKIIQGDLRVGLADGLILEAISKASNIDLNTIKATYGLTGNLGETARMALIEGGEKLKNICLKLFSPIRPMLADTAPNLEEAIRIHGRTSLEHKLDGVRVQIHKGGDRVEIYSRSLSKITQGLPDIVNLVRSEVMAEETILDGEVVGVDSEGRPIPFQDLMRRIGRMANVHESISKIPVRLFLFDILYLDGRSVASSPYEVRRQQLECICPKEMLTPRIVTDNIAQAEMFFEDSIRRGHEGLVSKNLGGIYIPGQRGKEWLKIKKADTLDVVIIAADWGSGRRSRWLSNYHLAVRDSHREKFLEVGKTFKGLTDEEFEYMTARLLTLKVSENDFTVKVRPEIVVEVAYDEVQKSPHYDSGYALRFARIKKIREDKSPREADTLDRLEEIHEAKFKRKARLTWDQH